MGSQNDSAIRDNSRFSLIDHKLSEASIVEKEILGFDYPQLSNADYENAWKTLEAAVIQIFESGFPQDSYGYLYKVVETICSYADMKELLNRLKNIFETCTNVSYPYCDRHNGLDFHDYLKVLIVYWDNYRICTRKICNIFMYLDRHIKLPSVQVSPIWDLSYHCFKTKIYKSVQDFEKEIMSGICSLIEKFRNSEIADCDVIAKVVNIMITLDLYENNFEPYFLKKSEDWFRKVSESKISSCGSEYKVYIHEADRLLQLENVILEKQVSVSSKKSLVGLFETHFVVNKLDTLVKYALPTYLKECDVSSLKVFYNLVDLAGCKMTDAAMKFYDFIVEQGTSIATDVVESKSKYRDSFPKLLEFQKQMQNILNTCFQSNTEFTDRLKSGFIHFVNKFSVPISEQVARYLDSVLRGGCKNKSEQELEELMDLILSILRYIKGNDMFEAYYRNLLAKRLLHGKSTSYELERLMISRFSTECGTDFTSKMQGMFKDMQISLDTTKNFKLVDNVRRSGPANDIDLSVVILTPINWPKYEPEEGCLTSEVRDLQSAFAKYYTGIYHGRELKWVSSLGSCVLKANLQCGNKELQVSIIQGMILMLFNDRDEISYEEIKEALGLTDSAQVDRALISLSCGKVRLLRKKIQCLEISPNEMFYFNTQFTNPKYRIRVNQIQTQEQPEESAKVSKEVGLDRVSAIDAAIVRTLKSQKILSYSNLMSKLMTTLPFQVETSMVKKCIESLMEREFIARSKLDANSYEYVA